VIAFASAGGLSLPDRDYYLKDDARFRRQPQGVRGPPGPHVPPARRRARRVGGALRHGRAHRDIARQASLSRVDQRNPYKLYHVLKARALKSLTPAFRWERLLRRRRLAKPKQVDVTEPDFFKEFDRLLRSESLADWRTYLRWHLASAKAPYLTEAFEREDFDFYSRYLEGVQEMPPALEAVRLELVDRDLGEALGQVYVGKAFPPGTRAAALDMVRRIQAAMDRRIRGLTGWRRPPRNGRSRSCTHE